MTVSQQGFGMKVIVVAGHKGGGGKTTVTSHLAVEAERSGAGPVAIMDLDPKNGLAQWWNARKAETPLFAVPPSGLAQGLRELGKKGIELVFIDTPPGIETATATALTMADLVLIPVQPNPLDLRVIASNLRFLEEAKKPMIFVINLVKSVKMSGDKAKSLSQHGTVATTVILDRTLYASSMIDGRTAPELGPMGPAAREVAQLWTYVNLRLHERRFMEKPVSFSTIGEEFGGLVRKGNAMAAPNAALPPLAAKVARPRRTQPASPPDTPSSRAGDTLRPPPSPLGRRVFDEWERPAPAGKVQCGLRLDPETNERLRRMAYELRLPAQPIIEKMLVRFLDEYESGHDDS